MIVTATEWANFFALRDHEAAQPEIAKSARAIRAAMDASTPRELAPGEWHLPCVDKGSERLHMSAWVKLSVARCAAVSYERHVNRNLEKDLARYAKLLEFKHMSPFEHAAKVAPSVGEVPRCVGWADSAWIPHYQPPFSPRYLLTDDDRWEIDGYFCGNFRAPWIQHRKLLPNEAVFG